MDPVVKDLTELGERFGGEVLRMWMRGCQGARSLP